MSEDKMEKRRYDKTRIRFNKKIRDIFIEEAMLTEEEQNILQWRIWKWSTVKIADELHCSVRTAQSRIDDLKARYDDIQKYRPELPVRTESPEEKWMDNPNNSGKYDDIIKKNTKK